MERSIIQKWQLPHPPEVVWDYLTKSELLAEWLMENDFQPVVGHKFMFRTYPKINFGFDGRVYCEVFEVVPLKRLSYSWKGGPGKGKITLESMVTWTLTPVDDGTELLLEHTGFRGWKNFMGYVAMNQGWGNKIRKRMRDLISKQAHEIHKD